jgi:hypothetical protein
MNEKILATIFTCFNRSWDNEGNTLYLKGNEHTLITISKTKNLLSRRLPSYLSH